MNDLYYNDQEWIAEAFYLDEEYSKQASRLAFFKINSHKLTLISHSFIATRTELERSIQDSLLNYSTPASILKVSGFFEEETDN